MSVSITYAVTVCNEHEEFLRLWSGIKRFIRPQDQIIIQSDLSSVTSEVLATIPIVPTDISNGVVDTQVLIISNPLNGNFAAFKNNFFDHATGDWIFQIDADEYPTDDLMRILPDLLDDNQDVQVIRVPRVNIVRGISKEHLDMWGWRVSYLNRPELMEQVKYDGSDYLKLIELTGGIQRIYDDGGEKMCSIHIPAINFPDYQWRLYKNDTSIRWKNKVHEVIDGYRQYASLPMEYSYCLIHDKTIMRQERQNKSYEQFN